MPRKKALLRSVPAPTPVPRQAVLAHSNIPLRSVPAPTNHIRRSPSPTNVSLRSSPKPAKLKLSSVPAPPKPKKTITKKKFSDLKDEIICYILNVCDAKEKLQGRYLSSIRHAFNLALTCSRFFTLFRHRLQAVDALYPSSNGYPSPFLPDYLSPVQMTWIARLAQGCLQVMRMPSYNKGTTDVLVAIEYCCHYIREIAFTDRGMVFPNLASSLFTSCKMITKIEIRAPQESTISAMWQSPCVFTEIVLMDVASECLNPLCTMIETKGNSLKLLQIAFDIRPRYGSFKVTEEEEKAYARIEDLGDYIKDHAAKELPNLDVLDISSSPYYVVDHDPYDTLDEPDRPIQAMLRSLKAALRKAKDRAPTLQNRMGTVDKLVMLRARGANIGFVKELMVDHLPINCARMVEVVFPGGSLLFDSNEETRPTVTSLQLGAHLLHGRESITREVGAVGTVDLGNMNMVEEFYEDTTRIRCKVARLLIEECANIKWIRAVFDTERKADNIDKGCVYITKVMKFAMLVTRLDISYQLIMYGHGINESFREMVETWGRVKVLRLANPESYGGQVERLTEQDCLSFVCGLQWMLACLNGKKLECILLEDVGLCEAWRNRGTVNVVRWGVNAIEIFEKDALVDCGTLKATLKRWLRDCDDASSMMMEQTLLT